MIDFHKKKKKMHNHSFIIRAYTVFMFDLEYKTQVSVQLYKTRAVLRSNSYKSTVFFYLNRLIIKWRVYMFMESKIHIYERLHEP